MTATDRAMQPPDAEATILIAGVSPGLARLTFASANMPEADTSARGPVANAHHFLSRARARTRGITWDVDRAHVI